MQWSNKAGILPILGFVAGILFMSPYANADMSGKYDFFTSCTPENNYCKSKQPCIAENNNCQKYKDKKGGIHYGCNLCPGYDVPYCSSAPQILGQIVIDGTNSPVAGVWVEWKDKKGNTRYAQTDNNGDYNFLTWGNCFNTEQLDVLNKTKIDANLDGAIDASDPFIFTGGVAAFNCGTTPGTIRVYPSQQYPDGTCNQLQFSYPNTSGIVNLSDPQGKVCKPLSTKQEESCKEPITTPQIIKCKPLVTPSPTGVKTVTAKTLEKDLKVSDTGAGGNIALSCLDTEICTTTTSGADSTSSLSQCKPKTLTDISSRRVILKGVGEIHRKLSFRQDTPVWILECIQNGSTYTCTTGSSSGDIQILGKDNFKALSATYGYTRNVYQAGSIDKVSQPITEANQFDSFEWESETPKAKTSSVFMIAYVNTNSGALTAGSAGGQQLATLSFESSCQLIQDPFGHVFDSVTLEPLTDAFVEITHKNISGNFEKLDTQETGTDGKYSFYVKDGSYKMTASKAHYTFPGKSSNLNANVSQFYSNLYHGEEIIQNGKPEMYDIPLDPVNKQWSEEYAKKNPARILNYFQTVHKQTKDYVIEGQVSHPRAILVAYADTTDSSKPGSFVKGRALTRTEADNSGFFKISVPFSSLKEDEFIGQLEAIKKNSQTKDSVSLNPLFNSIKGFAYDAKGSLIPGATVEILTAVSDKPVFTTHADSRGYFSIDSRNLPPLEVSLRFTSLNNTVDTVSSGTFLAQNTAATVSNGKNSTIALAKDANGDVLGISSSSEEPDKPPFSTRVWFILAILLAILIGSVYKVYRHK